jgi:hypothetical protein
MREPELAAAVAAEIAKWHDAFLAGNIDSGERDYRIDVAKDRLLNAQLAAIATDLQSEIRSLESGRWLTDNTAVADEAIARTIREALDEARMLRPLR